MVDNQTPPMQDFSGTNTKIRDIEEKQKILRDKTILIGKNLIEIRNKNNQEFLELKQEIEIIKQNMKRLVQFLETASSEFSKFAKKEDLQILVKQAKMFQPLQFINKKDLIEQ